MTDIGALMSKQIGPLPAGAWAGVVAVGIGYRVWRSRNPKTSTSGPTQSMLPMTDQTIGNLGLLGGLNQGTSGPGLATITDNNQWYQRATSYLLGRGNEPGLTDVALRKYMAGISLSAAEQAVINSALQSLGSLPYPPPPPSTSPITPVDPGPRPQVNVLSSLDTGTLMNQADIAYKSGTGYEEYAQELVNRVAHGGLSVNDPIWQQGDRGNLPRSAWFAAAPQINWQLKPRYPVNTP